MRAAFAALLMVAATPAVAQSGGLEEQLRSKLREVSGQLAQAQADAAPLKARAEAAEKERDTLKAQLAKAKPAARAAGPSAAERARMAALGSEAAAARVKATSSESAAAAANATAQATAADATRNIAAMRAERDAAQAAALTNLIAAQLSRETLAIAEAKNAKLYADAKEILERYRRVGFGDVLVSREPFVGKARVRLENDAERFGDRLYQGKFDARADAAKLGTAPAGSNALGRVTNTPKN